TDTFGDVFKFYDFGSVPPAARKGTFKSFADPDGNTVSVFSWSSDKPSEVRRTSGSLYESYLFSYIASGNNPGLISRLVLLRSTDSGSTWATVRQVQYTYYDTGANYGNIGDLEFAAVQDASSNTLDTSYYRYYTSNSSTGYTHGLKYAFGPQSYSRLIA